jgi:phosphonoacetaldehyde hydrolase
MNHSNHLQAVIFDWAGTTIDFGSLAPVRALMEAFRSVDVPISAAEARGPMGMAKREHLQTLLNVPAIAERWQVVRGRAPIDDDIDELYERFLPRQKQLLTSHAALVPGCLEAVAACRARGLKIGSTTGYTRELMDAVIRAAQKQGFEPDAIVVADDVVAGRPAPWMCFECARRLNVYPPSSIVVVDDTTVGIKAGLNAGMWTVGIVQSGNLVGLSREEFSRLDSDSRRSLEEAARERLTCSGAHYLVDLVGELPSLLPGIEERLQRGERP